MIKTSALGVGYLSGGCSRMSKTQLGEIRVWLLPVSMLQARPMSLPLTEAKKYGSLGMSVRYCSG